MNEITLFYQNSPPETPTRKNYFAKVKGTKHMQGICLGAGMQALGCKVQTETMSAVLSDSLSWLHEKRNRSAFFRYFSARSRLL